MGQLECVIIVIIYNHTENKFHTVQWYNRSIKFDILEICTKWINKTVIDFKYAYKVAHSFTIHTILKGTIVIRKFVQWIIVYVCGNTVDT